MYRHGIPVDRSTYENRPVLADFTAADCPDNPCSLDRIDRDLYRHSIGAGLAVHSGLVLITGGGALVMDRDARLSRRAGRGDHRRRAYSPATRADQIALRGPAVIKELKNLGKRVAMVADGINDAPTLLMADVAIAIGAGTEVAVQAGDVVLVRSDPRDVAGIIDLSRATYRKMLQNLWWAPAASSSRYRPRRAFSHLKGTCYRRRLRRS